MGIGTLGRPEGGQAVFAKKEDEMPVFSDNEFRKFLGEPLETRYEWGDEWRFMVSRDTLEDFKGSIKDTIFDHHTFFNLHEEIKALGFRFTADAIKDRYSGNPKDHKTQMGNLGEVFGAHLARTYLNFRGKPVYPKRYNTNPDQSQKGIDILGFKDKSSPAELLVGEVKVRTDFDQNAIREDYENLYKHQISGNLSKKLHFARAYFRDDRESLENVGRHEKQGTPVRSLLLSITEASRFEPFKKISGYRDKYGTIVNLLAIHIEINGLNELLPNLFSGESYA